MIIKSLNPDSAGNCRLKTNNHSLFMDKAAILVVIKTCLIITQGRKGLSDKICNYSMFVNVIIS